MAWECKVNQGFWARPWHVGYTKTGFIVQDVSLSASRAPDKYLGLFVGIPVTSGHLLNVIVLRPPLSRLIIVLSPLNLIPGQGSIHQASTLLHREPWRVLGSIRTRRNFNFEAPDHDVLT